MSTGAAAREYELKGREFERIRQMAYRFCGVDLSGKQVLVAARLGRKIRDLGCDSFETYCNQVEADASGEAFTAMIDALTTNHTSFFREPQHFQFLREKVLPSLPKEDPFRVWSAACSTGEEPYSILFTLAEALGEAVHARVGITASDISTRVLNTAAKGVYSVSATAGFEPGLLRRCMLKGTGAYAASCLVKRELRELIEFRHMNLLQDCSAVGPFHVVFCRNVMIYFDRQTQQTVVDNLLSRLMPGGYLFIGHAESLTGIEHGLTYVRSATYRKPGTWPQSEKVNRKQDAEGRL